MTKTFSKVFSVFTILALMLTAMPMQRASAAAIPLAASYSQNFDSLAITGTANPWADDSTLSGWYAARQTGGTFTTYRASTGSDNAGALYSFGILTSTERALGSISSGTPNSIFYGVRLVNNTGGNVTGLNVAYTGEQWRNDGSSTTNQRLDFAYQVGATALNSGTWVDFNSLDFVAPIPAPAIAGATVLNGNLAPNRTALSGAISGLSLAPGQEIWLRWLDINDPGPGGDQALSVDDLTISAVTAPIVPNLTINDVSANEGNSGTTSYDFTVNLSSPAGAGGVTFDIATQDDTATSPSDFTANSLTAQTIPAGSSSYSFSVLVNGDILTEADEVFFVNVTNVTGATVTSGQGDGTIINDDAADAAPTVTTTFPANGATNFPVGSNLAVTFSEPVNVSASWFTLACSTSGTVATTFSGGPTTFTLDPGVVLMHGETCTLTVLANQVNDQDGNDPPDNMVFNFVVGFTAYDICSDYTPIFAIQGSGLSTSIPGTVSTKGVVVGDFETTAAASGFYIQDLTGDGNPATSDGIFVFTGSSNLVSVGQVVRVTGFARERFSQTTLNGSNSNTSAVSAANIVNCGTGSVAPVNVTLPFADANFPERYEGMLVNFPQSLVIAEYFNYDRFGEIVLAQPLAGETRPFSGTAIDEPGVGPTSPANMRTATNALSRITLDDAQSTQNPGAPNLGALRHPNGLPFSLANKFRGGDTVQNAIGVLGYDFNLYRIIPTGPADYAVVNPRPASPDPVGTTNLRVAAMNTLNYFITADYPTGNPLDNKCGPLNNVECRGWDSDQANELTRQRAKLLAALAGLNADVIGLNELENSTGVEPLADIIAGLPGYAYINTGPIGTDAIKVGLIYKTAKVAPVGVFQTLDSADDPRFIDTKSRPALAQTFEDMSNGQRFTVVVNHLKSKGSDCVDVGDPDLGDGQGNCSGTRTLAAQALVDWLATDPTGSGDPDFLIMGDLNSYAMEDPIDAVKAGPDDTANTGDDYTNLIYNYQGAYAYSYTFDGQAGYLDHALANASMAAQITGAADWHINSDEPDVLDYDTSFKPNAQDNLYEPNAYRSSDHDALVVGMCTPPTLSVNLTHDSLWPANHKYVEVDASFVTSNDGAVVNLVSVTSNEPDNGLGDGDTANDIVIVDNDTIKLRAERSGTGEGRIYTITYQVTNSCGATVTATTTVIVPHNK